MAPKSLQPLYTSVPWTPTNFTPKDQDDHPTTTYPHPYPTLISPVDYQIQQFIPSTDINAFAAPLQPESTFISPITPALIAPAPTPELSTFPNQNSITYPQYPAPSPWSTCSTNHQLLTPQYPFFPSTILSYPPPPQQISQYPQHDPNNALPHYTVPINTYNNTHTQQNGNATEDLQYNTAFAYAYSTSFDTSHHHDMFQLQHKHQYQHEALAQNNAGICIVNRSDEDGYKEASGLIHFDSHSHINPSFQLREINQSAANPININLDHNISTSRNLKISSSIFRLNPRLSPSTAESTIDPKLSLWGHMELGGEDQDKGARECGTMNDPEHDQHDRISAIPISIPISNSFIPPHPPSAPSEGNADSQDNQRGHDDQSPTKRGRFSTSSLPLFSRKPSSTPLRKRRPPQLHLPPPSASMRIPAATIHTAPAASFSLDLFIPPTQRVDITTTVPQEPPKIVGWVSPDERPVPPLGYTVPGSETVPKIFEYDNQIDIAVPDVPVMINDNTNATTIDPPAPPSTLPFQPYEPKAVPRVTSYPQLRIPNTSPPSPPAPYMIVPGLNGFEVSYWRPQSNSQTRYPNMGLSGSLPIPPTTAAPWEVSVPPMDPSLPPSTASSWESISTLNDHFIPQSQEVEPVVYLNHELRNRGKTKIHHPPRYHPPPQEKKETWAICEVCKATISRTSDLQRHMRKHTGEKPYHCPYCTSSYARNDKLSGHILKNHPGRPRIIHRAKAENCTPNPVPNPDPRPSSSPIAHTQ